VLILTKLPDPPLKADGTLVIQEYTLALDQVKDLLEPGMETKVLISIPRAEFFAAVKHFVGDKAVNQLLETERKATGDTDALFLAIPNKTIIDYQREMLKGGRIENLDVIRPIEIGGKKWN